MLIDFGPGVFTGATNWLQIGVETNGVSSFTTLTPRQELTPVPYAIMANSASNLLGTLPAAQLSGTVPLPQLPSAVLTNNESSVTLNSLTLNGPLHLPDLGVNPDLIYSGNALLLHGDNNGNFFSGQQAGNSTTSGDFNTANGFQALFSNTGGNFNTAIGTETLYNNTHGNYNTANGSVALGLNKSGSGNTAVGYDALNQLGLNTGAGGTNNIALGYQAGYNFNANESSNIDIGNQGVPGDNNTIRIGTPGIQANTYIAGTIQSPVFNGGVSIGSGGPSGQLVVDTGAGTLTVRNDYGFTPGLTATGGSNPGILRFRNDLEIWPNDAATESGFLDVRDTSGTQTITLDGQSGTVTTTGLINSGSQTGTTEAPSEPGLVIRRVNSTDATVGSVIAQSDKLGLERDGSNGGLIIAIPANVGVQTIAAMGINNSGTQVNNFVTVPNEPGGATFQVYFDSQHVVYAQISFGNTIGNGHATQVTIFRAYDNNSWVGTVTSTYNQ